VPNDSFRTNRPYLVTSAPQKSDAVFPWRMAGPSAERAESPGKTTAVCGACVAANWPRIFQATEGDSHHGRAPQNETVRSQHARMAEIENPRQAASA
jgi:hypothetical protein